MSVNESAEHIEHAGHGSKRVAILITVLAALLAITEVGGKGAQNEYLGKNIVASDLWAFYQAKSIRQTVVRTSSDLLDVLSGEGKPIPGSPEIAKRMSDWRAQADRYESDPKTGEGRKELTERAKQAEKERDSALESYHLYEYASAAFQLAIVLASASVITEMVFLAFAGAGLGLIGTLLGLVAWLAPELLALVH